MATITKTQRNIILPRYILKRKEGIAILPLEEYEKMKEDLEMIQSKRLVEEIAKARQEIKRGKIMNFEEVKRKLNL